MVTTFNRKDLVSFGNFLLSDERRELFKLHPEADKLPPLEDRLSQVHHADIENWLETRRKGRQFNKLELIKHAGKFWQCIVCDHEYAIFGRIVQEEDHTRTSYEETFVISNDSRINEGVFEFERVGYDDITSEVRG